MDSARLEPDNGPSRLHGHAGIRPGGWGGSPNLYPSPMCRVLSCWPNFGRIVESGHLNLGKLQHGGRVLA